MSPLNKAIKDLDNKLFERIRSKCGGMESKMECTVMKALDDWVNS